MNKLKELRQRNNLTQKELCELTGIDYQNYNKYELGKNEPKIQTLIKIADYYGTSLDYLCEHQYNNQIGYIPDEVKETVKKMLLLDSVEIQKVDAYITAQLDAKNKK